MTHNTEIPLGHTLFPERLVDRNSRDPVNSIWVRHGDTIPYLDGPMVAIVGARACTSYGRSVARALARDLSVAGYTIVSGLARGVDGEAHRGALSGFGTTIAVLGCGVDRDYPAAHAELARQIVEAGGAILSEYEPGVEPAPWRFPARNRIIARLVDAVVVVEARERSGALICADFAIEAGVPLLAVPGEITNSVAEGTNALLEHGQARVCTGAESVHDTLVITGKAAA